MLLLQALLKHCGTAIIFEVLLPCLLKLWCSCPSLLQEPSAWALLKQIAAAEATAGGGL